VVVVVVNLLLLLVLCFFFFFSFLQQQVVLYYLHTAVLTWYGIGAAHVSGATSDTGPDCKKAFNVLARMQHGWTWLWCVYVHTYIHMLYVCVYAE
jgi:hypothetical protein